MNKREYAISLGLAQPGRGRLSREAHAAIAKAEAEGQTFSDAPSKAVKVTVSEGQEVTYARPVQEQVRSVEALYGYTEDGIKVGFTHCSTCMNHANFCKCPTIGLPYIVKTLDQTSTEMLGWNHDSRTEVGKSDQASDQSD